MVAPSFTLACGAELYPGYKLCKLLGRGGWGEVWKAQGSDGNYRALKFLPCSSPVEASREIRGLQSVRQVVHPNIIRIHRVWADSGYLVIDMELAEGTMQDLYEIYYEEYQESISPEILLSFLVQAASALDFLNTRQHTINDRRVAVRHCDVKPSNLLIMDKSLKLADFSLAVQTASPMWYHERVGTLNFAAPEVLRGWLSDRSDQYALAVSYFQLRTGQLPHPVVSSRRINNDRKYVRPPPDLSELPPREQKVLARALDPVPQARWNSCTEFIQNLQRIF
jgi:serine/threonine protein kinase